MMSLTRKPPRLLPFLSFTCSPGWGNPLTTVSEPNLPGLDMEQCMMDQCWNVFLSRNCCWQCHRSGGVNYDECSQHPRKCLSAKEVQYLFSSISGEYPELADIGSKQPPQVSAILSQKVAAVILREWSFFKTQDIHQQYLMVEWRFFVACFVKQRRQIMFDHSTQTKKDPRASECWTSAWIGMCDVWTSWVFLLSVVLSPKVCITFLGAYSLMVKRHLFEQFGRWPIWKDWNTLYRLC